MQEPRSRVRVLTAAMAFMAAVSPAVEALAQDIPSVAVRPAAMDPDGPNEGRWFVLAGDRGSTVQASAEVINPAEVPQGVHSWLADLAFTDDGTPNLVESEPTGVGAWGTVHDSEFTLEPGESRTVRFSIRIPDDAEPGDHVGSFVAETSNLQGEFRVNRRIARRLYVTVPGDAHRSFAIDGIEHVPDSWLWPSEAAVTTTLRNDGRIRLRPTIDVNGVDAEGADLLMSRSVEQYLAQGVDLPWYGGPVRLRVLAETDGGLVRNAVKTVWVIPWGLIILVVVAGSAVYAGRRWWKNRKSHTAELKQDIQRLERLITEQAKAQQTTAAVGAGLPAAEDVPEDEEAIILAALKRARRSDDDTALARIALAKHMTSGAALDLVLEALEAHDGKHRTALLDAAVSYGADALSTHERFGGLPDHVQADLGERLVTAGETVSGNGNGTPAKVPQPVLGQTDSDALRSALAEIKGVGPAKQETLVSRYGSLEAIRSADIEELTSMPGIGYATAREILDRLDG